MKSLRFGRDKRSFMPKVTIPRRLLSACLPLVILLALLLFGQVTGAIGQVAPSITVDVAAPFQGYVNPLVFGHSVFYASNNMWDYQTDALTTNDDVKSKIEALAPTILRFPGGEASDWCLWEDGLGSLAERPGRRPGQPADWGDTPNIFGIIEQMKLDNSLSAEAMLTVNYKTGLVGGAVYAYQPTDSLSQRLKRAQAMVAYVNGRTDDPKSLGTDNEGNNWYTVGYWARKRAAQGFPRPFEVRYWEVGNETYYTSTSPQGYANHFNAFVQAMKDVDPKIRIGAVGWNDLWGESGPAWAWNDAVIEGTKDYLDFLVIHPYYPAASLSQAGDSYTNDNWFKAIMGGATRALLDLTTIRGVIDAKAPQRKNQIGLAVTEYGILPYDSSDGVDYSNLPRALFDADLVMGLIKNNGPLRLCAATAWNLHSNNPTAAIGKIWATRVTRPQYYALKILRNKLISRLVLNAQVVSDTFVVPNVGTVSGTPPVPLLGALAAVTSSRKNLILAVINRSLGPGPMTATITLQGLVPQPVANVTTLWAENKWAHNENGEQVTETTDTIQNAAQNFSYAFKAHSLTLIEFQAQ